MASKNSVDEKALIVNYGPIISSDVEQRFEYPFAPRNLIPTLWAFTTSDLATFVVPVTCFGCFGALSGPLLTLGREPALSRIVLRTMLALLFVWTNTLVFDFANQGTFESLIEDSVNKPERPIPRGRITVAQTRTLLMWSLPLVLLLSWPLGTWVETSLLFHLTWMYNHLGGSDNGFIVRNAIIALAFGLYNHGSLRIVAGQVSDKGFQWVTLTSFVILTTMQIQDMKDQVGDRLRGRRTLPIVVGDRIARWSIALPVAAWSILCPLFLGAGLSGYLIPCCLGSFVAWRILFRRDQDDDRKTWKLWSVWMASLYLLPVFVQPDILMSGPFRLVGLIRTMLG